MKHIQLYEAFQETPLPPGVKEITYNDYHSKNGMLRSMQNVAFTKEENDVLGMLCKWGKLEKSSNSRKEFETSRCIPKTHGYWAPPGTTFGKKANGTYYLKTFYPDFSHKFYIAQSLDNLLSVAADVVKPELVPQWIEIR
jgi:hypothetical protein